MRQYHNARWSAAILFASVLVMPARGDAQTTEALQGAVTAPASIAPGVSVATPATSAVTTVAPLAAEATPAPLATQPRGVGLSRQAAADSTTPPVPAPANNNKGNTALMRVGAGTMIVGAIVGGDAGTIILLGGAALGIFGLYRYLTN